VPSIPALDSRTAPLAALAVTILAGALGALIDLVAGTRGWWLALGSLGLCFGALLLAASSVTPGQRQTRGQVLPPSDRR
jgi:hypothetical protein